MFTAAILALSLLHLTVCTPATDDPLPLSCIECDNDLTPVCGSDGVSYGNECVFECEVLIGEPGLVWEKKSCKSCLLRAYLLFCMG